MSGLEICGITVLLGGVSIAFGKLLRRMEPYEVDMPGKMERKHWSQTAAKAHETLELCEQELCLSFGVSPWDANATNHPVAELVHDHVFGRYRTFGQLEVLVDETLRQMAELSR